MRYCAMANATQNYQRLYQIALEQDGFFTTKQAKAAGYFTNSHPYHVKTRNWIREHRGIYRLANYPIGDRPDLMLWYLWSRNRKEEFQGVYSHETSLALHDLTDVNPSKLHMTVPKNFRRNSQIPPILILYFSDIPLDDVDQMHGVKVTTPMRTIIDIIKEGSLSEDLLKQAVSDALSRGLISRLKLEEAKNKSEELTDLMDKMSL